MDASLRCHHDAVATGAALDRHQPARDLPGDELLIAPQRLAPSASTPGDVVEQIARIHPDSVTLGLEHLCGSVGAFDKLAAASSGSVNSPR
jgi:hypothetical protein